MKKLLLLFFTLLTATLLAQQQTATYSINPSVFEDNQSITYEINAFQNYSDNDYQVDAPVEDFETGRIDKDKKNVS